MREESLDGSGHPESPIPGDSTEEPSPVLTGRDPSGAVQQAPEKYPVRKDGVGILREGRQSQSGHRGRTTKFCQFGQDGPGQPSTSSFLTGTIPRFHSSSQSGPPLSGGAAGSYWTPASQIRERPKTYQRGLGFQGRGKAKYQERRTGRGRPI